MIGYVVLLVVSYLLGAVPFGYLMAKAGAGVDVRTIGTAAEFDGSDSYAEAPPVR